MRLVETNDASFVVHLDENRHVSGALDDLISRIVAGRHHRRSGVSVDATCPKADVLDFIVLSAFLPSLGGAVSCSFLRLGCLGRKLSILRVHDDRSSQVMRQSRLAPVQTKL